MGCTDDVKEGRHVHAAHSTHVHARPGPSRGTSARICMHVRKHGGAASRGATSANIVKLDNSDCRRKLIRCNVGPLTVHFFEGGKNRRLMANKSEFIKLQLCMHTNGVPAVAEKRGAGHRASIVDWRAPCVLLPKTKFI